VGQPVRRERIAAGSLLALAAAGCAASGPSMVVLPAERHAVGAGAYATVLAPGEKPPSNFQGAPVTPKVVDGFVGPPATNEWWSSLIWQYDRGGKPNPYSAPLFAHPLALQARANGLGISYPTRPVIDRRSFSFPYAEELLLGVQGLEAPQARVASYGDWSVTVRWEAPSGTALSATFGHGLPFVYCRAAGGRPTVTVNPTWPASPTLPTSGSPRVIADRPGMLALVVNGHAYGLFAPGEARWIREGTRFVASVPAPVFSVAVLPDERPETLALFHRHAFAFVTGTRVAWRYDAATSSVVTSFQFQTTSADGSGAREPLVALYPHQWKQTSAAPSGLGYLSPRGPMRLLASDHFETRTPYHGILPVLPLVSGGSTDRARLAGLVQAAAGARDLFPAGADNTRGSYWTGKSMQRVALLAWLAEEVSETAARQRLVAALESKLADWLDGQAPNYFYYDRTWRTLVGIPSEYRSGWELNDHHFHWGYFLFAAATVARFDPAWAARERFGGMVDLLLRDAGNPDRHDHRFPFLRHFDPYAGHSWANGPALFEEGNNEESSSEDVNFAAGAFLWGALTGDLAARDLGIFLFAQTTAAVEQYWFDVDRTNFPPSFSRRAVGMVWGNGARYDTWWDHNPVYVHGINFLPFTGASLYLGLHPDYVRLNHQALVDAIHGEPVVWRDILWMFQALDDPQVALAAYEGDPHLDPEFGNSRAFLYHWLHGLADLGHVDGSVTADAPGYAVFSRGAGRRHVAWNPGSAPLTVNFSDGTTVDLPGHALRVVNSQGEASR
jgi:endoglucanase Acf2